MSTPNPNTKRRVLSTPLKAIGNTVCFDDNYHVGTVSDGANDSEAYAKLFASSPNLYNHVLAAYHELDSLLKLGSFHESEMKVIINTKLRLKKCLDDMDQKFFPSPVPVTLR